MSAIQANSAQSFNSPQAVLLERFGQVELALLESRSRILAVIDQELNVVRRWKQSVQFTANTDFPFEVVKPAMQTPSGMIEKIVPMNSVLRPKMYGEAQEDPNLVQATVDELNAALEAAFNSVAQG